MKKIFKDHTDNVLFIKRLEFKHESEFRVIFDHFDHKLLNYIEPTFCYSFNFNDIIEEVVFDPRMDKTLYSAYKEFIKSSGYKGNVKQSGLYSLSKYIFDL